MRLLLEMSGMEAVTGKRMQKQTDRNVVEQSGEPFLLSYRCYFSHTVLCVSRPASIGGTAQRAQVLRLIVDSGGKPG